jgi:hypothetical protein
VATKPITNASHAAIKSSLLFLPLRQPEKLTPYEKKTKRENGLKPTPAGHFTAGAQIHRNVGYVAVSAAHGH